MITVLIVEDEIPASSRLKSMLGETAPDLTIAGCTDTVVSTVKWLGSNPAPDLIFLDIQLGDGLSFEIFRQKKVESYIIFTTAYDEYALKAFEVNSLDYLLKPFDKIRLGQALEKFRKFSSAKRNIDVDELLFMLENRKKREKKRFVVTVADKIKVIETAEISWVYSKEKSTFICTSSGRHYPVEMSLDQIADQLSEDDFYRISRQFIISFSSIVRMDIMSKSRIKLTLDPPAGEDVLVSTARTPGFRKWLDR